MKKLSLIVALIFIGMYLNASEDNCSQTSHSWKSKKEAITQIENTTFKTSESIRTPYSSWMLSAHFYTCDDKFGFLLIKSEKNNFLHEDVPVTVWNALKNAKSVAGYYNFYIKNKYKFNTTKSNKPIL